MPALAELPIDQRAFLSIDTSDIDEARRLAGIARDAGASVIKLGLQLESATSWTTCSEVADEAGLDWVADAKLDDIPNTVEGTMKNIVGKYHPPIAVTVHCNSGVDSLRAANDVAKDKGITILGVTQLTSVEEKETKHTFGFGRRSLVRRRMDDILEAGVGGFVASARELKPVYLRYERFRHLFGMIPGTRSLGVAANDQKNTDTPFNAMLYGAGALVIGRQVTGSKNPRAAFSAVTEEMRSGVAFRERLKRIA